MNEYSVQGAIPVVPRKEEAVLTQKTIQFLYALDDEGMYHFQMIQWRAWRCRGDSTVVHHIVGPNSQTK